MPTTISAMVRPHSDGQTPVRDAGGNAGVTRGRAPDNTPRCCRGVVVTNYETLRQRRHGKRHVHCCEGFRQQKPEDGRRRHQIRR
jgi:hypothetical protein